MTSRKHTGIINLSVTCLKILSFRSRWQHGLPVIPFMWIPAYLHLLGGITLLWPPRLMKNRKWSQDFARRALFFLMNHCYVGAVVSSRNEPVRYFHSVSPRAIDSCLFAQIECRCWCNESAADAGLLWRTGVELRAKVIYTTDIMRGTQMNALRWKKRCIPKKKKKRPGASLR